MPESDSIGYFSEIFSSIQGEGGTVRGSCFGKRQIFVRFSGCNLVEGAFGTSGCHWCDSPQAHVTNVEKFTFEEVPGTQVLSSEQNPARMSRIVTIIKNLETRDLHSISFTGGEPLHQFRTVLALSKALKRANVKYPLYLETNGTIKLKDEQMRGIVENFAYCCCDIKDRSANAAQPKNWERLVKTEVGFIANMVIYDVEVFAKLVVTADTKLEDVQWICKLLSKIRFENGQVVGLAIQPAIVLDEQGKSNISVSPGYLNQIFETAASIIPVESLSLSVQAHKMVNLL